MLYMNPERVSRFYAVDEFSPKALEPLGYEIISLVEYEVITHDNKYTIFVPPNLDSSYWLLDGREAASNFYAAWEREGNHVYYSRFKTYEIFHVISLISVAAILMVYLVLWEKGSLLRKLGGKVKRLFKPGIGSR